MNTAKKCFIILVVLGLWMAYANADDREWRKERGGHHGPPPEAFAACDGKTAGDRTQFVAPNGETVEGTCEVADDRLVLRPDHPPERTGGGHHGPPPEAYTACEGKGSGDQAELIGRHGETVTGTCEQEGDRLVLRPDFMKNRSKAGPNGHSDE